MTPLRILDLFSGIGGFSLGLERTGGFETVAFCEQNPYASAVLRRHWPGVPVYRDVRDVGAVALACDGIPPPDVVCGGFPCQDISLAGKGAGLAGGRSGLWFEMLRIITETRPRFVIAENVAALRGRGLDEVLRGLSAIGYDAEWHCIPASAIGAPHRRDRVWIVAYPAVQRHEADPDENSGTAGAGLLRKVADATGERCRERWRQPAQRIAGGPRDTEPLADARGAGLEGLGLSSRIREEIARTRGDGWWRVEPDVGRVADGIPARTHRLRCLGNAVVPQIPELIGRAILSHVDIVSAQETPRL